VRRVASVPSWFVEILVCKGNPAVGVCAPHAKPVPLLVLQLHIMKLSGDRQLTSISWALRPPWQVGGLPQTIHNMRFTRIQSSDGERVSSCLTAMETRTQGDQSDKCG